MTTKNYDKEPVIPEGLVFDDADIPRPDGLVFDGEVVKKKEDAKKSGGPLSVEWLMQNTPGYYSPSRSAPVLTEETKRGLRLNPFFQTPSLDRPDLAAQTKEQVISGEMATAEEGRAIQRFLASPTIEELDDPTRKDVLDQIFSGKETELNITGQLDDVAKNRLKRERSEFTQRFYDAQLSSDDIEMIKRSNPIAFPKQYDNIPTPVIAQGINNKTKQLASWAKGVNEAGADNYVLTKDELESQKKARQDALDQLVGTNYIRKEGDQYVTDIPERQYMADQANGLQQQIDDTDLKLSYVKRDFDVNQYKPLEKKVFERNILGEISSMYAGMRPEDIYKYEGGMRMSNDDTMSEQQIAAMKKLHNDPNFKLGDIIKYDETNHLTPGSVVKLRELVTAIVNRDRNPIIEAHEHGAVSRKTRRGGAELQVGGLGQDVGAAEQQGLPIDPDDLIKRTINYFNYDVPARVLAEGYTNKWKSTPQGTAVAPFIEAQKKIAANNAEVTKFESAIKTSLDAGYLSINDKYSRILEVNPEYQKLVSEWQTHVGNRLITPAQAQIEINKAINNNPALKPIIEAKEKEVGRLRNTANTERERYLIEAGGKVDPNLEVDSEGRLTVKGMTRDQLNAAMADYQKGYEQELENTYQGQQDFIEKKADMINQGMRETFGAFGGAFMTGVTGALDDLGAATSRWLYHKTGMAGDTMNYFEGERQRPLNVGEYATNHYQYKGLESLLDPAYYGFASGQSFPYAAPALVLGAATGGTTVGIIASSIGGATLESAENALLTRNELYTEGKDKDGLKITSQDADRMAAVQFKTELLPNITFQALELGALLRTAKYVKPGLSLKTAGKGVVDVVSAGGAEAIQEGVQGYVQADVKQQARTGEGLDLFDYLQTDDFTQNFFGGFAGGVTMGGGVKPLAYAKSIQNWQAMIKESQAAFGNAGRNDFANDVPFANAMHAQMGGTSAEFRDGIRMRIANEQYKDNREKENLNRALAYSQSLDKVVKKEGIVPDNINELYAAHTVAMAEMYESLAEADKGSSQSAVYTQQAKDFRNKSIEALNGEAKIYYAIDAQGRPIFMNERTANVMGNAKSFEQLKRDGRIREVGAVNDDVFNQNISNIVNATPAAVQASPAEDPAGDRWKQNIRAISERNDIDEVTKKALMDIEDKRHADELAAQTKQGRAPVTYVTTGQITSLGVPVVKNDIKSGGSTIGITEVFEDPQNGHRFTYVELNEDNRRTGIGLQVYRDANEKSLQATGKPLWSIDANLNENSKRVWDSLIRTGEAEFVDGKYRFKTQAAPTVVAPVVTGESSQEQQPGTLFERAKAVATGGLQENLSKPEATQDVAATEQQLREQAIDTPTGTLAALGNDEELVTDMLGTYPVDQLEQRIDYYTTRLTEELSEADIADIDNQVRLLEKGIDKSVSKTDTEKVSAGDAIRNSLKVNLSKFGDGGLQSNILGIPIGIWNAAVETVATLIDGGMSIANAIRKGFEEIRKENKEVEELAIVGVLNKLTEGLVDKPVREKDEKYGEYAMRVMEWRRNMLAKPNLANADVYQQAGTTKTPAQVKQESQQELSFIKNVNAGIDLLKGNLTMSNADFNKQLKLPQDDRMTYVGALKYLKGTNPEATEQLNQLRRADPTRVSMSELSLLKKQYMDWERGYKAGDKESTDRMNAIKQDISNLLSEYNEAGLFKGVKYTPQELLRMAGYVNGAVNEQSLNNFRNMVQGLIEKADYGRKVAKVKELTGKVKDTLKKKTSADKKIVTANLQPVIKDLAKLNPLRVENIDELTEIMTDVVESQYTKDRPVPAYTREALIDYIAKEKTYDIVQTGKETMDKFYNVTTDEDTQSLITAGKVKNLPGEQQLQNVVNGIVSNTARSHKESIAELNAVYEQLNKFGKQVQAAMKTVKESNGALTAQDLPVIDYNESSVTVDNDREDNRKVLEDLAIAMKNSLDPDQPGYTEEQKKTLSLLKSIDVTGFDANKLRLFTNVINNVTMNEDFAGAGVFETVSRGQNNIKKLFDFLDSTGRKIQSKRKAKKFIRDRLRTGREALSSTEQEVLEIASNDPHSMVEVMKAVEFDKIKEGWANTDKTLKQKLKQPLQDILDSGAIDTKDQKSQMRLGMYSWLNQSKTTDTELERRTEFAKRLNEVKQDIAIKEASKEEDNVAEAQALKEVLNDLSEKIKATKGIDIRTDAITDKDSSLLNGVGFLTQGEQQAYDTIRAFHDEYRPQFIDIMERVLNKEFIGYDNYMVDKTRKLKGGLAEAKLEDSQFFQQTNKEVADDEEGSFAGRIQGNRIKQPISGEDTRVIDYNFFTNTISNARDTLYNINTIEDRLVADNVVSSKQMQDGVGHVKAEMLKKNLLKEVQAAVGHSKNSSDGLKLASDVVNVMTRLAAKKNLYGVMAFPKQLFSAVANTMAFMGIDAPYVAKAAYLAFENQDVKDILDSREISMRGGTKGGTNVGPELADTDMGKQLFKLDKVISNPKEFTGEERKLMGYFLEAGDVYGAKATWVAMYAKYLKNNGIVKNFSDIDWAKEKENLNRDAAIFADVTTSAQLNTNSKNAMGSALLNNDSASNVLRGMYALFGMFGVNKSINSYLKLKALGQKGAKGSVISAIGKLFTGQISKDAGQAQKDYAVKGLVAGMFEDIAFAGVKFVFGKLTIMALGQMVMGMLGDEEGEKKLKEYLDKTTDPQTAAQDIATNAIGNYLFSFTGNVGQEAIQKGINNIYKQFGGEKNIFPQLPDNPNMKKVGGLTGASGLEDFVGDIYRLGRILFDNTDNEGNPIDKPDAKTAKIEKVYSAISLIHDMAQVLGIGDADFERLLQRRDRQIDQALGKRYGDPYWVDLSDMQTDELTLGGRKRELNDEQQKYYKEQKKIRMKQLEKANVPKENKTQMAVEFAKAMMMRKYKNSELKIAPPEEKKKE